MGWLVGLGLTGCLLTAAGLGVRVRRLHARLDATRSELDRRCRQEAAAAAIRLAVHEATDVVEIGRLGLEAIVAALDVPVGGLWVVEDCELFLTATHEWRHRPRLRTRLLVGEGPAGQAALERQAFQVSGEEDGFGELHTLVVPVLSGEDVVGVFELGVRSAAHGDFVRAALADALRTVGNAWGASRAREEVAMRRQVLRDSEARLRAVLDAATDAIVSIDSRGFVRSANRAAAEMFGVSGGELLTRRFEELVPGFHVEDGGGQHVARREDGSELPVQIGLAAFSLGGERLYAGILRDVSAQAEWERQLTEQKRRAEEQALKMEEASRYKSEFVANMSHELRTPLNSLLILAQILAGNRSGRLGEDEVGYAATILEAGRDLLRLIDDVLDLARIEAGQMRLDPVEVDVLELVDRLRGTFEPIAAETGLRFEVVFDEGHPRWVWTDPRRIQQVLTNLLSNAFKFTERGSVRLGVGGGPSSLVFVVEDTGIGIPAESRERVFRAFEQVEVGTARRFGGTGLGLAICKDLVEGLGGEVSVESTVGVGSTFTIRLPVGEAQAASPEAETALPEALPVARFDGCDALVVDDDIRSAFALAAVLEGMGMGVRYCEDAGRALALLEEGHPSLVLMDIMMPGMGGLDAIAAIRARGWRDLPVVALTAAAMEEDRRRCFDAGADAYLAKPVDVHALASEIGVLVARRQAS